MAVRALVISATLLASACSSSTANIQFECAAGSNCSGSLGVGGTLFYLLYRDGALASDAQLVADGTIVRVDTSRSSPAIVGLSPGTTQVRMVGTGGATLSTASVNVAALSDVALYANAPVSMQGPLADSQYNAKYVVPTGQRITMHLQPKVGTEPSIGAHFFDVQIDGVEHRCFGEPQVCTSSVATDEVFLDPFAAGDHVMSLHALDGGPDFAFRLTAQ